jgi:hypothetical protein
MVCVFPVSLQSTRAMLKEVHALLHELGPYSDIMTQPKILHLRNPTIHPDMYRQYHNNHRFGKLTCPKMDDKQWGPALDTVIANVECPPHLTCFSAMIISYEDTNRETHVGYHKDPPAYERIVSFTLEGRGIMKIRHGNQRGISYELVPGLGIALEECDCFQAKHSISSSGRLGVVLRYVDAAIDHPL